MKRVVVILLMGLLQLGTIQGQPKTGGNVQTLKIAYITKQLSLTTEEAQKFWPVYFNYFDEIKQARVNQKTDVLAFEEAVLNIRKKYRDEFKKILGSNERAGKVLTADREFNNMVKKELQNRAEQRKKLRQKTAE
ncbi:MAG: hypothetical protein GXC72_00125 [Chitinophagaceae bacterium]|jgi:hypothetical protein|nr:hypothetical protein [Chitinophagaceae bacterium]